MLFIKMNYDLSMEEICGVLEIKERTAFRRLEHAYLNFAVALNNSKYVFDLFIIKENLGEKVIVKKTFTLTMNGVPKNGELSVIPDIGLYNTTTFVITCDGWTDDTTQTENLEFEFTYFEKNTLNNKYLSKWSKVNEVYSNFTVVYYQKPINIITITCRVRDHLGAISTRVKEITIVNSITNPLFSIEAAV